jgi:branched-chain amino acid aminotransferase
VSSVASVDGVILPIERAVIPVRDRGFLYGDGVFETIRVYGGRPFAARDHVARLSRSAAALRIGLPVTTSEIARELDAALAHSGEAEAVVRLIVTRGTNPELSLLPPRPLKATRVILVEPLRLPPKEVYARGLSAMTLRWGRAPESGPAASAKLLPYLTNLLALEEAKAHGFDEAIFVAADGLVREATTANVFVVDDAGHVVTPPDGPGVLAGITRAHVLALASSIGYSCAIEPLAVSVLAKAREVFLTSSVREIASVVNVDGANVGDGEPGKIARKLHRSLRALAGAAGPNPWE